MGVGAFSPLPKNSVLEKFPGEFRRAWNTFLAIQDHDMLVMSRLGRFRE